MSTTLLQKIKDKKAKVAVIGIGYVGLPLAVEVAHAGFDVVGYDKSAEKVRMLGQAKSYIGDISDAQLEPLVKSGKLKGSLDADALATADIVVICVPTPLNKTKDPDNSFIMSAADDLVPRLKKDTLIVLESTTFPGFTREVLVPRLEETGLKVGKDIFVAFSPERVDPGNARFQTKNTPKVVGGHTKACTEAVWPSTASSSTSWCRCRRATRPRCASCWRTPSARSTSASSTKSRSCARSSASTPGRSSTPRPPSRSASCPSTRGPGPAATASRWTRSTSPGRCG